MLWPYEEHIYVALLLKARGRQLWVVKPEDVILFPMQHFLVSV